MGKKLTAEEVGQKVINEPHRGFDQCSKCKGIESQGLMLPDSEDLEDDSLVCDECKTSKDKGVSKSRVWTVEVCRTATAFRTIKVIATTEAEACDKAIDVAGDEEFGSGEADYSTPDGAH